MEVVDLLAPVGRGPLWGTATEELNATLLVWGPAEQVPDHVNTERDVLLVVLEGSGTLVLDGASLPLHAGGVVVIPKGSRRSITAGSGGIRYLTAHRARGGLTIRPAVLA